MSDQQASDMVREAGRQAKSTLAETADMVQGVASDAGAKAQEYAREASRQATAAAQSLFGQGNVVLDVVERTVVENPWGAVLIAGALGYGLACLVKRR
ncbi:MAG TPA: hypothetical protein VFC56_06950 [Stellaceae bacterium]|nr:hypothetical protein [Stellaceae bacterium]